MPRLSRDEALAMIFGSSNITNSKESKKINKDDYCLGNGYFNHKKFKNFLKRLRSLDKKITIKYVINNSIGYPPYIETKKLKIKSITTTIFKDHAIYKYIINDNEFKFEIPADAKEISKIYDPVKYKKFFGYKWTYSGPYNYLLLYVK